MSMKQNQGADRPTSDSTSTDQSTDADSSANDVLAGYDSDWIELERDDDGIVWFELTAGAVYDREFRSDLGRAFKAIDDADPAAVVLAGDPGAFAIGDDESGDDFEDAFGGSAGSFDDAIGTDQDLQAMFDAVETLGVPVVAALEGEVHGYGLALALAADIRIGGESSTHSCPGVTRGDLPAEGVTQRLTATVGQARAREFLLSGSTYDAETMDDWGLLNYVVDDDAVVDRARSLAEDFADRPTDAYECMKRAIRAASPGSDPEFGFGTMNKRRFGLSGDDERV